MTRRAAFLLALLLLFAPAASAQQAAPPGPASLDSVLDRAEALEPLETVIVAQGGKILAERGYRGNSTEQPTNIKSASKTIVSALVGIAIDKGVLKGVDQKIAPILRPHLPENPDPRIHDITVSHLLSMQAGLGRTSGPNYGRWVSSRDWVRAALAMPFDDEPGGNMLYSTGSTHLLSAVLTRAAGRSTLQLARDWLGPLEDFSIAAWERDPQGFYLGGNQMAMSPRSLLAFGELYRNGGRTAEGKKLVSPEWIETSWRPRTNSRYTGDGYGYGWFLRTIGGQDVRYAWGYGGQMLYIVPELGLTVVMTSQEDNPSARNGHRDDLHALLAEIIGAVEAGEQAGGAGGAKEG
jgi:CubicO group peptidase (beta-lactamase class C family)